MIKNETKNRHKKINKTNTIKALPQKGGGWAVVHYRKTSTGTYTTPCAENIKTKAQATKKLNKEVKSLKKQIASRPKRKTPYP